ncbi:cyclase family protein [Actinoplanes friuliensis]|uniref:Cyclase family protein n=1 Tax=Actinoplanes friuliensis DSM 7358 TaxID=1246995 RepID=U5W426_9ACTN|nr:cyclase family protein [Actinoplanes friuliensis]AGZ42661.1 cyclase family protein [Actinoplanes friuliensis DSM 7358]
MLNLVSLSHVNDPATTIVYPGDPPFELETVATIGDDGFFLQYVRVGEHTGTHWGAPGHFTAGAALADDLEPADLCRPAVKIDVREQCARDADFELSVQDLQDWERRHGRIPAESVVVLWTGWDSRWGTEAYLNRDEDGVVHQPGFSLEAVEWLTATGRLGHRGGTGTDTFGPDPGRDTTYAVSRLVYQRHRISLEVLADLGALPATGAHILCGGQINKGGSGSTALIYGVLPPG